MSGLRCAAAPYRRMNDPLGCYTQGAVFGDVSDQVIGARRRDLGTLGSQVLVILGHDVGVRPDLGIVGLVVQAGAIVRDGADSRLASQYGDECAGERILVVLGSACNALAGL